MSSSRRYFIEFAYDGTNYHGWQKQPDAITVQERLEEGLKLLLKQPVLTTGAGRTDTGVHAKQMFAHFDLEKPAQIENIVYRLNRWLPEDISVFNLYEVGSEDHARFDAISRSYEYHIHLRPDPFFNKNSYILYRKPDFGLMQEAADQLLGTKNFKCFSRSKTQVKTYNCTVTEARFQIDDHHVIFHITADRFLRNMVRAVMGTLLEIGYGKKMVEDLDHIIKSQDRNQAGPSAPGQGLYLTKIVYPDRVPLHS
ncbi:tRNA pseudouridine(38-40) synthase TruA [Nonlabens spongiae]|uniref:tRNA pseudouridine synthase A n=1 Tax=Nonlabens spongiae TaxID=331648 RepID=A0A1W6MNI6_9FLAO|nr:tRNA pseudouridine(38-40) synthase TruA [Nonlabens spongiae]ARN79155.1 tRNA pseudouridine(38-40) synthase TruA [Nonlabens spongiae]